MGNPIIEFCHLHLSAPKKGYYHDFFKHYHLTFEDDAKVKEDFRGEVNLIFERNGIAFHLNEKGHVSRVVSNELQPLIHSNFNTSDDKINDLLNNCCKKILSPKIEERIHALEKLWDAFERSKTLSGDDKKSSVTNLLVKVANGNESFYKMINSEAINLTDIGNNFQIRHFENGKVEIKDPQHIDYLFFRMMSLITLSIPHLK